MKIEYLSKFTRKVTTDTEYQLQPSGLVNGARSPG